MLFKNDKISVRQLQILLILDVFGTGVIILPRRVSEFAGSDGWLLIILATLIASVYILLITSLGEMFPSAGFVTYASQIASKPIAILIGIIFIFKLLFSAALELRIFTEIIKQIMLFNTPSQVISVSLILVSALAAFKGYETRARLAEILIFIIVIPMVFVFCVAAADVDFSNLKPFLVTPPENIIRGGIGASFAFSGIELCLLAFPYVNDPYNVKKGACLSVFIIGFLMLAVTVVTIARFGESLDRHMLPVLEMMDAINLPGSFIERQNALVMSFWIISVFAIINACLFFSAVIIKDILGCRSPREFSQKKDGGFYIFICAALVYGLSFVPKSVSEAYALIDIANSTLGVFYLFVIPLFLLVIAKLRRMGD